METDIVAGAGFGVGFWVSIVVFAVTFALIISEKLHRTVIAFFGAMTMLIAGMIFDFYNGEQAISAIDFNTIGLLMGMMTIVAVLETTGVFQYLGILTAKKTKGNPWFLIVALGTLTSVLSMILDNVTTIILIVPVTIIIARMIKISPLPLLIAEAILSNVGGTATLVGDPPNIMIGSVADFSFNAFLVHSLPVVTVVWFVTLAILRIVYKKEISQQPQNVDELMKMNEKEAIEDPRTLKIILGVLALVVLLFFVHHKLHLQPSMVALIGAALALILVAPRTDPQKIFEKLELSVLAFFGALFVIVGGLEHSGVLNYLASLLVDGAAENPVMTAIIVLWASAILSAIVDNIPFTVAMIPVIAFLGAQGVDVNLLWWALVFGVGFGGNGTPIGSSAGVIVVSKSEQTDNPISFKEWIRVGGTVMIVGLLVTTGLILLFHEHLSNEDIAGQCPSYLSEPTEKCPDAGGDMEIKVGH